MSGEGPVLILLVGWLVLEGPSSIPVYLLSSLV